MRIPLLSSLASELSRSSAEQRLRRQAREWTVSMWEAKLWKHSSWLGIPIKQWGTDLVVFQQMLWEQRPSVVVETGTAAGGSALFFASILELLGSGRVVSVDITQSEEMKCTVASRPGGGRVDFVAGDSKAPETLTRVRELVGGDRNVLVLLDSNHGYAHVKAELEAYAEFVSPGNLLVVADTICRELARLPGHAHLREDNPLRAVDEFLREDPRFQRDERWEKFLVTFSPGGFLRRVR
jgi:cephalosporin hydroxylase